MIIQCPQCTTRYAIDAATLGNQGRKVSCAKCGNVWFQTTPTDSPKPIESTPTATTNVTRQSVDSVSNTSFKQRLKNACPWLAIILVVVGLLGITYWQKKAITESWPPSIKIFNMLGISVKQVGDGLEVTEDRATQATIDGVSVLKVNGFVVNRNNYDVTLPRIVMVFRDVNLTLFKEELTPEHDIIPAQGRVAFSGVFKTYPAGLKDYKIVFE